MQEITTRRNALLPPIDKGKFLMLKNIQGITDKILNILCF